MKNEHEQHKEMEDILKAELDREARAILAEIEADESLKDLTMPDEAEVELMQRIQKLEEEKAAQEKLSEKDKEALRLGREIQMQKENRIEGENKDSAEIGGNVVAFRKKKRRTYLLVAVVAVMVMMMGMTSVGEVPLVTSIKELVYGEKEVTKVNSAREDESEFEEGVDEKIEVYEEIQETFQVDVIRLNYRPSGTEMIDYEINADANNAVILYECEGLIMEYQMVFNCNSQTYGYMVGDELLSEKKFMVDNIEIQLKKYAIENSEDFTYIGEFEFQNTYYIFNATAFPEEEIEKILKNIKKY